jgi:hypothetical protein
MLRSMRDLEQYRVSAAEGDLGNVADFLLDQTSWAVRFLIVDTGGAGSTCKLRFGPIAFRGIDDSSKRFRLVVSSLIGLAEPGSDAQLRSAREITRYRPEGTAGSIGKVWDLIVDDDTWHIQCVVLAPANAEAEELSRQYAWLPGWAGGAVGCDRSVLATHRRMPSAPACAATIENEVVERASDWADAYEEFQTRAADEAVIGNARKRPLA